MKAYWNNPAAAIKEHDVRSTDQRRPLRGRENGVASHECVAHAAESCQAARLLEQEMTRSRVQPSERVILCAIAAALMLSVLLPDAAAAGATQRHCPTKPHAGRHDGGDRRTSRQVLLCRIAVSNRQRQSVGEAGRLRARHGISIELGGPEPVGN